MSELKKLKADIYSFRDEHKKSSEKIKESLDELKKLLEKIAKNAKKEI